MPRERATIATALAAKGFAVETKGRDHDFFLFEHEGLVRAVYTKLSRGTGYRTIDDSLLARMSKQVQLTKAQFLELVDCPLDRDGYVTLLRSQGVLRS